MYRPGVGIIGVGSVRGGSIGKVSALELVGGYKGVSRCIGGVKGLGCKGGVSEGTSA